MLLLMEDVVVRQNFDFAPLFGSTVGFDRVFDLLQSATQVGKTDSGFPPYDIERTGKDAYRIILAVAGFTSDELTLTAERNLLTVEGKRAGDAKPDRELLHRGIGSRAFKQTFQLADHVKVTAATLADGLLTVELVREIPEVMRPRQIQIGGKSAERGPNKIEHQAA